jgi:hypothetical protein
MVLTLFLVGVFLICMAMLWTEGLWGNGITWINVVISGMMAASLWERVAAFFDSKAPSFTYLWDILAVWLVFALTMGILRGVTGYLSTRKVRFHKLMESYGNILMAVIVATTMTCFTAWTLHLAPLAPAPFRGADLTRSFAANTWIRAMHFSSRGTMQGSGEFPPDGYMIKYYQRREALANIEGFRVGVR